MALLIGIDGDDTLWHNERVFSMTEDRIRALVAPYAPTHDLDRRLLETERRNLATLGYGVKSFTLSMIETAIDVTDGTIPASVIGRIIDAGKAMMTHPVELLDGVAETLPRLAGEYPLVLITKGDLFHQESKVARSGLLEHFDRVEIVSEKDESTYLRLLHGTDPRDFVMIGDSVKSDILPTLEIGGRAIHIPGFREWALEAAEIDARHAGRWWRAASFTDIPDLLIKELQ